jgi:hypothetical protein
MSDKLAHDVPAENYWRFTIPNLATIVRPRELQDSLRVLVPFNPNLAFILGNIRKIN